MLLHEHPDFRVLISKISEERQIAPQIVEKDYWVMHCLWGLQRQKFTFYMKGGTTLSKAFGITKRFSEDIDILIEPEGELPIGKSQNKDAHITARRKFFDSLASRIKIPDILRVERDTAFDDEKMRSAGIRLHYQTKLDRFNAIKDGILLEVGFDQVSPNQPRDISSWAYDEGVQAIPQIEDNRAIQVVCYLPEYTFVEKMQAISTKFRQQQASGRFGPNFMRHYYDLYKLLGTESVLNFLGTEPYLTHKKKRFRDADEKAISKNEAFLLSDSTVRKQYQQQMDLTQDLYFNDFVSMDDILARFREYIPRM